MGVRKLKGTLIAFVFALAIFGGLLVLRSQDTREVSNSACEGLNGVINTYNSSNYPALKDFIEANIEARRRAERLALGVGDLEEAELQRNTAEAYSAIHDRFSSLPKAPC